MRQELLSFYKNYKNRVLWFLVLLLIVVFGFLQTSVFAQLIATTPTPLPISTILPTPIPTPEPDTTGPVFVSINGISVEPTTAAIAWTTDELANGYVEYGTTNSYGSRTTQSVVASLEHLQPLSNLNPSTTYHYRIVTTDEAGNVSYSDEQTVITSDEPEIIDSEPPVISDISISNITTGGTTITVLTDELTIIKVQYGLDENYGSETPISTDFSDENAIDLTGLQSATRYHYRVIVQDVSGNESSSPDETFTTHSLTTPTPIPSSAPLVTATPLATRTPTPTAIFSPAPIITPIITGSPTIAPSPSPIISILPTSTPIPTPILLISDIEIANISSSSAMITWVTNIPTDGRVTFGTSPEYESQVSSIYSQAEQHKAKISGLQSGTNYHYQIIATASALTTNSDNYEFNTLFEPITVEPILVISNVAVEYIATSSATIRWNTNQPANSHIDYGTTSGYGLQIIGETLVQSHSVVLNNLKSATKYNYLIRATNAIGDTTLYENKRFTTAAIPNVIIVTPVPTPKVIYDEDEDLAINRPEPVRLPGGGYGQPPLHPPLSKIIKVEALDSQVVFLWKNPKDITKLANVFIVRKDLSAHSRDARNGTIVYRGNGTTFTDTDLENGKKYTYGFFTKDADDLESSGAVLFKVTPKAKKKSVSLPVIPKAVQRTPLFKFSNDLIVGSQGNAVRHLQLILTQESAIYPEGKINGIFDQTMVQAVLKFQKKYNLPTSGFADTRTRNKLESLARVPHLPTPTFQKIILFPEDLYVGRRSSLVEYLQRFLVMEGLYPEKLITGYFGSLTKQAVIRFQKQNAVQPAFGFVGPITRALIENIQKAKKIKI